MDGLERDLKGTARVLRLSLTSDVGHQAAAKYGVRAVPTTLLFDGQGQLAHQQAGLPDGDEFLRRARALGAAQSQ